MKDIISKLLAIYHYAKDIHYTANGHDFYSIHKQMDEICDGIHDQIDSIFEVCYLGTGKTPPTSYEILKVATAIIPEENNRKDLIELNGIHLIELLDLISNTIGAIEDIKKQYITYGGEQSLFDDIQKSLLQKKGLLERTVNI